MNSKIIVNPSYDVSGPDHFPALLLIHGSTVTRKMWLPQLRNLCDTFHVIAPDLPGHGALEQTSFNFSSAVQTIAEVIDQEANGRALVAGLSLGGYVAMQFAEKYPEKTAGLILSGCSLNFRGVFGLYLRMISGLMKIGLFEQSQTKAEEKVRQMFPPELVDVADAQIQAGVFPQSLGPSIAEMAGIDFRASLTRFGGPCLILNGEHDKASRREEKKFAMALPNGQVQIIPDAGHACSLDQPDLYNQTICAFGQSIGWVMRKFMDDPYPVSISS